MAREVFRFPAHDSAKPVADFRAVDVVVINPVLVARVIRRIDVNAFDLPAVVGE